MWKLARNHGNIFSKLQTVGKKSDHELISSDNSWSGWDKLPGHSHCKPPFPLINFLSQEDIVLTRPKIVV